MDAGCGILGARCVNVFHGLWRRGRREGSQWSSGTGETTGPRTTDNGTEALRFDDGGWSQLVFMSGKGEGGDDGELGAQGPRVTGGATGKRLELARGVVSVAEAQA